ncbi:hypothetical protein DL96DRAFT_1683114 [Flagelloscypha sp. PMI_526]|nr:hypothetical protein DL96DRAFT_1683114 [Flagelloscypha sp. PMI_526]
MSEVISSLYPAVEVHVPAKTMFFGSHQTGDQGIGQTLRFLGNRIRFDTRLFWNTKYFSAKIGAGAVLPSIKVEGMQTSGRTFLDGCAGVDKGVSLSSEGDIALSRRIGQAGQIDDDKRQCAVLNRANQRAGTSPFLGGSFGGWLRRVVYIPHHWREFVRLNKVLKSVLLLAKVEDGEDAFPEVYEPIVGELFARLYVFVGVAVWITEEWMVLGVHENDGELGFECGRGSENGIQVGGNDIAWQ